MLRMMTCAVALLAFTSTAFADCGRNANGQAVRNDQQGLTMAANTPSSSTNDNGVTTTQTRRGGEAKTKNGKGVVTTPNGKTCAKSANRQGCR